MIVGKGGRGFWPAAKLLCSVISLAGCSPGGLRRTARCSLDASNLQDVVDVNIKKKKEQGQLLEQTYWQLVAPWTRLDCLSWSYLYRFEQ